MASYEGATTRAKADLSTLVRTSRFIIPAALLTAAFAAYGATLPPDAELWERIVFAVAGTLGGALLLGLLAFVVLIATAPTHQRNETREALAATTGEAARTLTEAENRRVTMRVEANTRVAKAEQERDAALRRVEIAQLLPQATSLDGILRTEVGTGRRLLADAVALDPTGNIGGLDDLVRRGEAWVDRVSDALVDYDEREMHERWTNDPRWRYGLRPITREQIDRYVVPPIRERLEVLRAFQRELRKLGGPGGERPEVHRLRIKLTQADRLLLTFEELNLSPFETAVTALEPINDVLVWVDEVRALLIEVAPEWVPEFDGTAPVAPHEPELDDVTVQAAMDMLAQPRLLLLGRVIRDLQEHGRV